MGLVQRPPAWDCGPADPPQHKSMISMPWRSLFPLFSLAGTSLLFLAAGTLTGAVGGRRAPLRPLICRTLLCRNADFEFAAFKCSAVFFFTENESRSPLTSQGQFHPISRHQSPSPSRCFVKDLFICVLIIPLSPCLSPPPAVLFKLPVQQCDEKARK